MSNDLPEDPFFPNFDAIYETNENGQDFINLVMRGHCRVCLGDRGRLYFINDLEREPRRLARHMEKATETELREYLKDANVPTLAEAIQECEEIYAAIEREVEG